MTTGPRGIALLKKWEDCKLVAYQDIRGIWTIGWGHTGQGIGPGVRWAQWQADAQLMEDVKYAEHCIDTSVSVPLIQGEYDALVCLIHNIGTGAFLGSTLLRKLNDSDYDGAAAEFPKWDHANKKVVEGLYNRRLEEQTLFEDTGYAIATG